MYTIQLDVPKLHLKFSNSTFSSSNINNSEQHYQAVFGESKGQIFGKFTPSCL